MSSRSRRRRGFLEHYRLDDAYMLKPDRAKGRPGIYGGFSPEGNPVLVKAWARSSTPALKSGAFFRTSAGPIEIPAASLPLNPGLLVEGRASIDHAAGAWFKEAVREMTVFAEHYDFAISLLLLDDAPPLATLEEEAEPDTYDRFVPAARRREW